MPQNFVVAAIAEAVKGETLMARRSSLMNARRVSPPTTT